MDKEQEKKAQRVCYVVKNGIPDHWTVTTAVDDFDAVIFPSIPTTILADYGAKYGWKLMRDEPGRVLRDWNPNEEWLSDGQL